jgi:hypothetical protein
MRIKKYPFYVADEWGRICSGWEFREDAKDFIKEYPGVPLKVYTKVGWERKFNEFDALGGYTATDSRVWHTNESFAKLLANHPMTKRQFGAVMQYHNKPKKNPTLITNIRKGYRLRETDTGKIWTILGPGPKIRGISRYIIHGADGANYSIKRDDLIEGQRTGRYVILDALR